MKGIKQGDLAELKYLLNQAVFKLAICKVCLVIRAVKYGFSWFVSHIIRLRQRTLAHFIYIVGVIPENIEMIEEDASEEDLLSV